MVFENSVGPVNRRAREARRTQEEQSGMIRIGKVVDATAFRRCTQGIHVLGGSEAEGAEAWRGFRRSVDSGDAVRPDNVVLVDEMAVATAGGAEEGS
jgi:hypothetical protein